jgi:hypothetical protein
VRAPESPLSVDELGRRRHDIRPAHVGIEQQDVVVIGIHDTVPLLQRKPHQQALRLVVAARARDQVHSRHGIGAGLSGMRVEARHRGAVGLRTEDDLPQAFQPMKPDEARLAGGLVVLEALTRLQKGTQVIRHVDLHEGLTRARRAEIIPSRPGLDRG